MLISVKHYLMQLTENDLDKKNDNLYDGKNKNNNKEVKKNNPKNQYNQ